MRLHPNSSHLIDPVAFAKDFTEALELTDSQPDYYSLLKSQPIFSQVEERCKIPDRCALPNQLFADPSLYFQWKYNREEKVKSKVSKQIKTIKVTPNKNQPINPPKPFLTDFVKEDLESASRTRIAQVSANKRAKLNNLKVDVRTSNQVVEREDSPLSPLTDLSNDSGGEESKKSINQSSSHIKGENGDEPPSPKYKGLVFPPNHPMDIVPPELHLQSLGSIDVNDLLTNIALTLEQRLHNLIFLLDSSRIRSVQELNRHELVGKQRVEMNYLPSTKTKPRHHSSSDQGLGRSVPVFSIAIFFPNKKPQYRMQEFLLLGSQPLTDLRDALYCLSDFVASAIEPPCPSKPGAALQNEKVDRLNSRTKKMSSSYFFVEDVFYCDTRADKSEDYANTIMEWGSDPARQTQPNNPFKSLKLAHGESVCFQDLAWRIDQPYLFTHQGNCEHIFIVKEIRLLDPKIDDTVFDAYPKPVFMSKINRHKCQMCNLFPAKYITVGDIHAGESPCFFCEHCFDPFHFDEDGQPLYDFATYFYAYD
jgi:hypothetical protein